MLNRALAKFRGKFDSLVDGSKGQETSVRVLICHKSIWGSDTLVSALKDQNQISQNYWIERIEVVQFCRAVIDCLIQENFDLLIIDSELDRGTISDAIRKVREIDKNIKIIVSTNVKTPEINQLAASGKINSILFVPIQVVPMWQIIHELLSK